jgi:hypothetical protein
MAPISKLKCPSCGGTDLKSGRTSGYGRTFIPKGQFMWIGYVGHSFVCLACGFLGHYVDEKAIEDMRRRDGKRKRTMP